jgi:hypothetical protein
MTSKAVQAARETTIGRPDWVWTWNGICFGYRSGDSLFTYDGAEVGRFSGREVYGVDGRYLGELSSAEDGSRLVTNLYKKLRSTTAFVPAFERGYRRPGNRIGQGPFYCGHEDFPSPEEAKAFATLA